MNRTCSCVSTSSVSLSADAPQTPPGHSTAWFRVKQKKASKNKHSKLHLAFVISRESGRLKGPVLPWALCFHWEKAALKAICSPLQKPHGFTGKNKVSMLHIQHRRGLIADITSFVTRRKIQIIYQKRYKKDLNSQKKGQFCFPK